MHRRPTNISSASLSRTGTALVTATKTVLVHLDMAKGHALKPLVMLLPAFQGECGLIVCGYNLLALVFIQLLKRALK